MVDKRNSVIILKEYLEKSGISVNIGKNKARGNKGIFISKNKGFRVDVAKDLDENAIISTLIHEYTHFVHYKYEKSLSTYAFLFDVACDEIKEELLKVSVHYVPKESAKTLFDLKDAVMSEIKDLEYNLKLRCGDFKRSKPLNFIEKNLKNPLKYFLKYDKIKLGKNIYSIDNIRNDFPDITDAEIFYLRLKSKQRLQKRITSKISRLNQYYNKPSELVARFAELYFTNNELAKALAPKCTEIMSKTTVQEFKNLEKLLSLQSAK